VRLTLLFLVLAGLFGLAALWQERHVEALRRERLLIEAEASGELARTEGGILAAGHGVVWVGSPSGAEPVPRPSPPARPAARPAAETPTRAAGTGAGPSTSPAAAPLQPAPYSVEVQPKQTLSGICYLHYGTAPTELVHAVARFNGLENPDQLQAGAALELPELESLSLGR